MKYKFAPAYISNFFTPFYDLVIEQGGLGKSFQERIIKIADIKDKETILDIGCGSGSLVVLIKSKYPGSKLIGIDPDPNILKIAQKKVNKENLDIKLLNSWAEDLPVESSSIDLVISSLSFHHLPTEIKKMALKEIYRVLKKDGRFILADIAKPDSLFWKIKYRVDLERILATGEYMKDNLEGRIPELVKEAGFEVKEILPRHRGIQFLYSTKKNIELISRII